MELRERKKTNQQLKDIDRKKGPRQDDYSKM